MFKRFTKSFEDFAKYVQPERHAWLLLLTSAVCGQQAATVVSFQWTIILGCICFALVVLVVLLMRHNR